MRTTLDIRNEILEKVKEYASVRSISKGEAVSEVLERGFNAEVPTKWENGILVFSPGPDGAVTTEHVMKLKDGLESEP
jgi:hypothetical protein